MEWTSVPTGEAGSLRSLHGRPVVVEFWHTKCERCPAALQAMDGRASKASAAAVVACALATSEDAPAELAKVRALVEDDLPHLTHVFMTWAQKEEAKRTFRFASVPHCVVFDRFGAQLVSAPPWADEVGRALAEVGV